MYLSALCEMAVSANTKLLEKVPEVYRTTDVCLKAVESDVSTLFYVDEEIKYELFHNHLSLELMEKAIVYSARWLKYVPYCPDIIELCIRYMEQDFF